MKKMAMLEKMIYLTQVNVLPVQAHIDPMILMILILQNPAIILVLNVQEEEIILVHLATKEELKLVLNAFAMKELIIMKIPKMKLNVMIATILASAVMVL